ncbi:MAG: hypothetical protein CYG60_12600 [Actinobacteria bacterium]|nr:MAG: hypothetical protein CYG60_12600 [Actinomycetota bacterium]
MLLPSIFETPERASDASLVPRVPLQDQVFFVRCGGALRYLPVARYVAQVGRRVRAACSIGNWTYGRMGSATFCYHRCYVRVVPSGLFSPVVCDEGVQTTVFVARLKHGIVRDCVDELTCYRGPGISTPRLRAGGVPERHD